MISPLSAQIELSLASERQTFLLYEPVVLRVEMRNTSEREIFFENSKKTPWLSFLVTNANGKKVGADQKFVPSPVKLAGEKTVRLPVDITPWYQMRKTGQYQVQAVVHLPGKENPFVTQPLMINLGKGDVIWSESRSLMGKERVYSLVRFIDQNKTRLYLRVEEPRSNIVYCTTFLGKITPSLNVPAPLFDRKRRLHILHPTGEQAYRYTIAGVGGKILKTEDISSSSLVLARDSKGNVFPNWAGKK